jgi:ABC-type spermidine/putrescine transport system permease subunit II
MTRRRWEWSYLPVYGLGVLLLALLIAPLVLSLLLAFAPGRVLEIPAPADFSLRWFHVFFDDDVWTTAAGNSIRIALLATAISLLTGLPAAIAFERHDFPGKSLWGLLILMPLFVPPVVLGMQNLAWHQRIGIWGTDLSVALSHCLLGMPVVFLVIRAGLASAGPHLEEAAHGLGASPIVVFWRVTLPLVLPSVLTATFFAFILSFNEFLMALFLVTANTQTLSTAIWPQLQNNPTPLIAAVSVIVLIITAVPLALAVKLLNAADYERRRIP